MGINIFKQIERSVGRMGKQIEKTVQHAGKQIEKGAQHAGKQIEREAKAELNRVLGREPTASGMSATEPTAVEDKFEPAKAKPAVITVPPAPSTLLSDALVSGCKRDMTHIAGQLGFATSPIVVDHKERTVSMAMTNALTNETVNLRLPYIAGEKPEGTYQRMAAEMKLFPEQMAMARAQMAELKQSTGQQPGLSAHQLAALSTLSGAFAALAVGRSDDFLRQVMDLAGQLERSTRE
jgi:hypothetical protein